MPLEIFEKISTLQYNYLEQFHYNSFYKWDLPIFISLILLGSDPSFNISVWTKLPLLRPLSLAHIPMHIIPSLFSFSQYIAILSRGW